VTVNQLINLRLSSRSRVLLAVACSVLVVLVGFADLHSGVGFEMHFFYLIPVVLSAWYVGQRIATAIATFSAADWMAMRFVAQLPDYSVLMDFINEAARLFVYLLIVFIISHLRQALEREHRLARLDPLTQLANRRAFRERGDQEILRMERYQRPFTSVMIDLDNFKGVNDSQGHEAGDQVLRQVAAVLASHVRSSDMVGRMGGDEFAVLMPETNSSAALAIATKLRQELLDAMGEGGWPVTFSIGVATFVQPPPSTEEVIRRADDLMYSGKQSGKDQIRCETF